jgi:hypothetical protein
MQTLAFTRGLVEGDGGAAALLGMKPNPPDWTLRAILMSFLFPR